MAPQAACLSVFVGSRFEKRDVLAFLAAAMDARGPGVGVRVARRSAQAGSPDDEEEDGRGRVVVRDTQRDLSCILEPHRYASRVLSTTKAEPAGPIHRSAPVERRIVPRFALRPVTPGDAPFLQALYRSSREDEVSAWGWSDPEVEAFLQMQGQVERRARALHHPDADHVVVEVEGRAVGRLLVDRSSERILVVDIGLLPEAQGLGIGSAILGDLVEEAETRGVPVVLHVRRGHRAERLYRRLGFSVTVEGEMQLTLAFYPTLRRVAASGSSRREE